jgi:hypothetical protein
VNTVAVWLSMAILLGVAIFTVIRVVRSRMRAPSDADRVYRSQADDHASRPSPPDAADPKGNGLKPPG